MEAAEWYKLRNDRTNRIDGILLDSNAKIISVVVQKHSSLSGQAMAICTANILARWCRRVIFYMPDDIPCILDQWSGQKLHEVVKTIMVSADPYGEFSIESRNKGAEGEFVITIGQPTSKDQYWIDAEGWVAGFGYGTSPKEIKSNSDEFNIVGAIYAASFINASIFSSYIKEKEPAPFQRWHSLFDFSTSTNYSELKNPIINQPPSIGKIWQIGAGAVGSSFDFILSLIPVSGSIHILDYDEIEIPNTSSSLIFTCDNALKNLQKVEACKNTLKFNKNLYITGDGDMDYSQFIKTANLDEDYPDIILCFANEKNIWSTIQYNDPPIVLHATTSSNWGVNFGRHLPFKEWCIVCRFGMKDYQYTPTCSTSVEKAEANTEEKLGILPFLSPIAAVLVISEILKLSIKDIIEYPKNQNFIQLSMKNIANSLPQPFFKPPKYNCPICSDQNESSYHNGYAKSKYHD